MVVYLVPIGRGRYELYSEVPAEADAAADEHPEGSVARAVHRARRQWHELVSTARAGRSSGRLARWRDDVVRRVAESMAEQRTLWALRGESTATLTHPSSLETTSAEAVLREALAHARSHHRRWLLIDTAAFVASGLLMLLPGPNLVAYYFAARLVGHYFSWRGAQQAQEGTSWATVAEPALDELARLAETPRNVRAPAVQAIADRLALPRLAAFFDRAAVPVP